MIFVIFLNNVVDDGVQCSVAVISDVSAAVGDAVWITRFVSVFFLKGFSHVYNFSLPFLLIL